MSRRKREGEAGAAASEDVSPIPASEVLESAPAEVPEPSKLVNHAVRLEAWVRIRFPGKADRAAGFVHHATKQGLKSMSVVEWNAKYEEFMKKPAGAH